MKLDPPPALHPPRGAGVQGGRGGGEQKQSRGAFSQANTAVVHLSGICGSSCPRSSRTCSCTILGWAEHQQPGI